MLAVHVYKHTRNELHICMCISILLHFRLCLLFYFRLFFHSRNSKRAKIFIGALNYVRVRKICSVVRINKMRLASTEYSKYGCWIRRLFFRAFSLIFAAI